MGSCLETILARHSVRSFAPDPIPEEVILEMLEAGRVAPSAQNRQCWRFIVVQDREIIHKLAFKSGFIGTINFFLKDVPLVIVACADPKHSVRLNNQDYYLVDTSIAFQQIMLVALEHGIGSCWLAAFNEESVKKILEIPKQIRVVAMSPFGYPKDRETMYGKLVKQFAGSHKRHPMEKIVCRNRWTL